MWKDKFKNLALIKYLLKIDRFSFLQQTSKLNVQNVLSTGHNTAKTPELLMYAHILYYYYLTR